MSNSPLLSPWSLLLAILIPISYLWLMLEAFRPCGCGSPERQRAARDSAGQLFKHTGVKAWWIFSAIVTTLSVLMGYLLFLINLWTDAFDNNPKDELVYIGVFGFMASALLWAPLVFMVSLNKWPRWIAVMPVWGTALFNILILAWLPNYLSESEVGTHILYYVPWSISALHHTILDGIVWGWGFFGVWGITGYVNTPKPVRLFYRTKLSLHLSRVEKKPLIK